MDTERLLPEIDEVNRPFWEACRDGKLKVQRCTESGRLIHPPRYTSPYAAGAALEWVEVCGRGRIWSVIEPHPPLTPQFAELAPYNAVVVALDEDPRIRLVGNVVADEKSEINSVRFEEIAIGDAVRVVFQPVTAEFLFPRWVRSDPQ